MFGDVLHILQYFAWISWNILGYLDSADDMFDMFRRSKELVAMTAQKPEFRNVVLVVHQNKRLLVTPRLMLVVFFFSIAIK